MARDFGITLRQEDILEVSTDTSLSLDSECSWMQIEIESWRPQRRMIEKLAENTLTKRKECAPQSVKACKMLTMWVPLIFAAHNTW